MVKFTLQITYSLCASSIDVVSLKSFRLKGGFFGATDLSFCKIFFYIKAYMPELFEGRIKNQDDLGKFPLAAIESA